MCLHTAAESRATISVGWARNVASNVCKQCRFASFVTPARAAQHHRTQATLYLAK